LEILISLKPGHVENVRERVEIVAFGELRQLFHEGCDIESGAGGFQRRRGAIVGCHRALASPALVGLVVAATRPFYGHYNLDKA
jgi:hypothetical protein